MKSMAHYAGKGRIPRHRYLRQRKIREDVRGRVSENPVPELDPGMSGKRTALVTNPYSDGVPSDAVSVEHLTKCYRSG